VTSTEFSARAAVADRFFERLPFTPDRFQLEAVAAIARGGSVVVTAPTAAGKTLVAEAAVQIAISEGLRSFYTTPIKALSNQKFADFREIHGHDAVGLLTGDNVIDGDAPIVVMTTEVLRNMIYADSPALGRLGFVVLDEVHYLQDRQRGSVWEEVIIHLPPEIPILALSATMANSAEFTEWVRERRGETTLVVEDTRPVPLESQFMIKDRHREGAIEMLPVFDKRGARANPDILRLLKKNRGRHRRFAAPRRLEVVEHLARRDLIPLIYFIFSRAGVDQAAALVARGGLGLTNEAERQEIRNVAESRTAQLSQGDLGVLGYPGWLGNLEKGVAAHHAGLVPAFKEATEELFRQGLVKVVFATDTLALGINMPARAVVLERFTKFSGDGHDLLRPGDYTQLTGRAGRRGIDVAGTAVILFDHQVPFDRVAAIAAEGSHPLTSSFQPTYNMAVNMVACYDQDRAKELLRASFVQFRADYRAALLNDRAMAQASEIADLRQEAESSYGDIWEFSADGAAAQIGSILRDFVQLTEAGDVLRLSKDLDDCWVILARGYGANPRLLLVNGVADVRRLSADRLPPEVTRVGRVGLPEPVRSRDTRYQGHVARRLREFVPDDDWLSPGVVGHPVAEDPDLAHKLALVRRVHRMEKELGKLQRRQKNAGSGVVADFQRRLGLLEELEYVRGWALQAKGERLRFLYSELDLLLAESVDRELLTETAAPDLAALCTLFTYEPRSADSLGEWPTTLTADRGARIFELRDQLVELELKHRFQPMRHIDAGFAAIAYDWTDGAALEQLFDDDGAQAGDFVRNMRQLLDLLRQLRDRYPDLADPARQAVRRIDRGVVAAGGQV